MKNLVVYIFFLVAVLIGMLLVFPGKLNGLIGEYLPTRQELLVLFIVGLSVGIIISGVILFFRAVRASKLVNQKKEY